MIPDNLIINADDFGLDARVSQAISQCLDDGLINSFSVFPFRDAFHASLLKSILTRHPKVRVGAHLAVVDENFREHPGHFRDFLIRYATGRMPASKVAALWKAQIEALGVHLGGTRRIAHLDSHQHLHVLPGLWPAARALQQEYRIARLRVPYESLRRSVTCKFPFGLGLQALARFRAAGESPRFLGFLSSTRFTLQANHAGLERVLLEPGKAFELMVHPALPAGRAASADAIGHGSARAKDASGQGEAHALETGTYIAHSQEREIDELRLTGEFFDRAAWA